MLYAPIFRQAKERMRGKMWTVALTQQPGDWPLSPTRLRAGVRIMNTTRP